MITIKNVQMLDGEVTDHTLASSEDHVIDAGGRFTVFPALIDSHISFGPTNAENWKVAVNSAVRGGVTTALEIPTKLNLCETKKTLEEKIQVVHKALIDIDMPFFRCFYYATPDLNNIKEIGFSKKSMEGLVIQLDADQKEILNDDWEKVFQIAAWEDIPIVINAHNENAYADKSFLEKAIALTEKQSVRLYVLNVSTHEELSLIQAAKERALLVYSETTTEHLFPADGSTPHHLWEALNNGRIDTIGSGYIADSQKGPRILFNGNFSASDPIFLLPQLLTAQRQGKISIEKVVRFTSSHVCDILEVTPSRDVVLVDMKTECAIQKVKENHSSNLKLVGWPVCTIMDGHIFTPPQQGYQMVHQTAPTIKL